MRSMGSPSWLRRQGVGHPVAIPAVHKTDRSCTGADAAVRTNARLRSTTLREAKNNCQFTVTDRADSQNLSRALASSPAPLSIHGIRLATALYSALAGAALSASSPREDADASGPSVAKALSENRAMPNRQMTPTAVFDLHLMSKFLANIGILSWKLSFGFFLRSNDWRVPSFHLARVRVQPKVN